MLLKRITGLLEPFKPLNVQNFQWSLVLPVNFKVRKLTTGAVNMSGTEAKEGQPKKNISKAMRAYLERAQEHDQFMKKQKQEFQIGTRHLANMMGENPETFTQEDIDNAIEYLFPSGLYEKKARPLMKPPEEVFPQRKAAEFDEMGRPHHFLFYTGKSNFYQVLYDTVEHINEINKFEDVMIRKGLKPDPNLALELSGYQWLDKVDLEKKIVETINDRDYDSFVNAMERLCSLPYSYKAKDFITQYRRPLMSQLQNFEAPKPQYDKDGRTFISTYECKRKRAIGDVTVRMPGTGKITINGQDITYFTDIQPREQVSDRLRTGYRLLRLGLEQIAQKSNNRAKDPKKLRRVHT